MTSQKVRPGYEDDYRRWQDRTNEVAGEFAGFEDTEQYPPTSTEGNEWVVVFRFSHLDQLTAWLDSDTRRELLEQGRALFEEPPTQEVLAGGTPVHDAVTAVISHDVRPDQERAFVSWQEKILTAQRKFPGFMGSELFRPVKGIQDKWVTAFRFDTRQHLDEWLESATRRKLLDEGRDAFVSYDVRKVGSAFGSWFRFEQGAEEGVPPNWKQAMSVVLALYPTVEVLNLTVGSQLDALGMPGYLALFISNVLSVSILTWLLMPLVNRALAFWLMPGRARSLRIDVAGVAVVVVCWLAFIVIFGLTTG
ncbi:antibiotic biosynthesis monooxygenase [Streptomyces sp. KM273126]|uniref:antibiotic biosynthesis monooxygenase n=1 Tax=Streptomyces sp. KM273126 TaxID=2545247 RepID=UPI0010386F96|nr:antibiotic biosynthesis monooxygenase [Streptomyces sp. KM273126]MBA2813021.1 antibiotic biosynthesis monooxygenase [Streptomyces sp. KM273126]